MISSPNATVFTTGKPDRTQRPVSLYPYDLGMFICVVFIKFLLHNYTHKKSGNVLPQAVYIIKKEIVV